MSLVILDRLHIILEILVNDQKPIIQLISYLLLCKDSLKTALEHHWKPLDLWWLLCLNYVVGVGKRKL